MQYQLMFTNQNTKTIDNPNDIVPTVYKYANSRCPVGSNEYKILDTIIIEHYATHTVNELVEITGVYKARVLWRIKFLMENGYIKPKSRVYLTKEQIKDLLEYKKSLEQQMQSVNKKLRRATAR